MKHTLLIILVLAMAGFLLGNLSRAVAAPASPSAVETIPSPIQNPVPGEVTRRATRPSQVGFEHHTLGIAMEAVRTQVQGQVQTEFHLRSIPPLPGRRYEPQALGHAVFTLNGVQVVLTAQDQWFAALPVDLIGRDNEFAVQVFAPDGRRLLAMENHFGL
jgi:hypothetical protein